MGDYMHMGKEREDAPCYSFCPDFDYPVSRRLFVLELYFSCLIRNQTERPSDGKSVLQRCPVLGHEDPESGGRG